MREITSWTQLFSFSRLVLRLHSALPLSSWRLPRWCAAKMGARKTFKKQHAGFPPVIYVKREQDGSLKYFLCGERPEQLHLEVGETAELARYTFCDHVHAEVKVVLKGDKS